MRTVHSALLLAATLAASAGAANIYILSSGDPSIDTAARDALITRGHAATIGVAYTAFDGTQSLAGYQGVYLQANANWGQGDMPAPGQAALLAFIDGGGELVTCEWVIWMAAAQARFLNLLPAFEVVPSTVYGGGSTTQFDRVTPDATLNAGLPNSFAFTLVQIAGSEGHLTPRVGSAVFYSSSNIGAPGLVGGRYGQGYVLHFSTVCGAAQMEDANFGRLFANAFNWTGTGLCYANCDGSTTAPILNVADFTCFLNRFGSGDAYANCDASTAAPTLNVADFICFLNRFGQGC